MDVNVTYIVNWRYEVIRGNPTPEEVHEILARHLPDVMELYTFIGKSDDGQFTRSLRNDPLAVPIDEWHESWTTIIKVSFVSWDSPVSSKE